MSDSAAYIPGNTGVSNDNFETIQESAAEKDPEQVPVPVTEPDNFELQEDVFDDDDQEMSEAIGNIDDEENTPINGNTAQADLNNSLDLSVNFDVDEVQDEYGRAVLQCGDPNEFMVDLANVDVVTLEELNNASVPVDTVTESGQNSAGDHVSMEAESVSVAPEPETGGPVSVLPRPESAQSCAGDQVLGDVSPVVPGPGPESVSTQAETPGTSAQLEPVSAEVPTKR